MRKLTIYSVLIFLLLLVAPKSNAALKITAEFYGAKLSTVIDALSKISKQNVIWDKEAVKLRDKKIYVYIQRPMDVRKVFVRIVNENGLIAVRENGIIKLSKADELFISTPPVVLKYLGKDVFNELVSLVKKNVSRSATIEVNKATYSIYVRDTKENIQKLKRYVSAYLSPLKKEAEKLAKMEEKQKQRLAKLEEEKQKVESLLIKKEIQIPYEDFKEIEDSLIETLSSYGRYNYNKKTHVLTIIDIRDNIPKLSRIIAKARKVPIETKCYYARALEPSELLLNIKERYLTKYGTIIYKSAKESEKVTAQTIQLQTGGSTGGGSQAQKIEQKEKIITSLPKVCITDVPQVIKKISKDYSNVLLKRPYQVLIEARIVQIESTYKKDLGIQWGITARGSLGGSGFYSIGNHGLTNNFMFDFPAANVATGSGSAIGIVLGGLNKSLDLRLSALEQIGKSKILSRPKVITIDGEAAEISQGFEIPYVTTGSLNGAQVTNVEFKEAVLKLSVIPRTTLDGNIIMSITITQDIPDFKNTVSGYVPIQTKAVISKIVAKDGSTVVIGGILEQENFDQQNGVPGLAKIPILGNLFKNKSKHLTKRELLIFLSPRIIYE